MSKIKDIIYTIEESNPVFSIPWQADAFVTAVSLSHNGLYRWSEWVENFSSVISTYPQQENETSEEAYYRQWLLSLENMLNQKNIFSTSEIDTRTEKWRRAYLNTPHGHPVELSAADRIAQDENEHHHHHHHHYDRHECNEKHPHTRPEAKPLRVFRGTV